MEEGSRREFVTRLLRFAACAAMLSVPAREGEVPIGWCVPDPVPRILAKISRSEGYYLRGSIPSTHNNPGGLIFARQRGASRGEFGVQSLPFARFKKKSDGWRALEDDVRAKMALGIPLSTAWKYLDKEEK